MLKDINMDKIFSIIIPQRNSIGTLARLFNSIPVSDRIEIILVDNSPTPITKKDIGIDRDYTLLWAAPERYAGGARNVGLEKATGKWLLFCDADDFFSANAFDIFFSYKDSESDVIYFKCDGLNTDTGLRSNRGDMYNNLIDAYHCGEIDEWSLRFEFVVPWAKMVKREIVKTHNIKFDEVVAANDAFFSILTGYHAKSIIADDAIVYMVTSTKGSLTKRKDEKAIESRFVVGLRSNRYLKDHGFSSKQQSLMLLLKRSLDYGLPVTIRFLKLMIKYGQNPFVGWRNWFSTLNKMNKN